MRPVFSDREGLRIAIEMERRGEDFYRRAARVSTSTDTVALLCSLAEDEVRHAAEFTRLYAMEPEAHADDPYPEEKSAYLSAIAADIAFPDGLMGLHRAGFNDPFAVLETAIRSEKDSVLFYMELAEAALTRTARETLLEIARQERGHLTILLDRMDKLKQRGDGTAF